MFFPQFYIYILLNQYVVCVGIAIALAVVAAVITQIFLIKQNRIGWLRQANVEQNQAKSNEAFAGFKTFKLLN